jgi:hypothetical protein
MFARQRFQHMREGRPIAILRRGGILMSTRLEAILAFLILLLLAAALPLSATEEEEELFKAIRARQADIVDGLLDHKPELLSARRKGSSPVMAALFILDNGFIRTSKNETLKAVMKHRPTLDVYEASGVGDLARVRELVRADPKLATSWGAGGWTPLHIAAFGGHTDVVRFLLEHGAMAQVNARAKTRFLNTPLQTALLTGEYGTAKLLIENGADVLVRQNEGFAPIHEAAFLGRRDLVDLLLEHGAEINARSNDGRTPLSEATRAKYTEMAEYLKSKGAVAGPLAEAQGEPPE